MRRNRPVLFKGRHFEAELIVLCLRWYVRYPLSLRQVEEIMAERNLSVDHVTIWRWVQRYGPELNRRCRPELRNTNRSWRVDETYCRVAGKWTYLYRAVDSTGATPRPRVINVDGNPPQWTPKTGQPWTSEKRPQASVLRTLISTPRTTLGGEQCLERRKEAT